MSSIITKIKDCFCLCLCTGLFLSLVSHGEELSSVDIHSTSTTKLPIPEPIRKAGALRICSESGYLPFEMKDTQGSWLGFDIEMMKTYASYLGVGIEWHDVKWDGIIPSLLTGKCDFIASAMAKTKERERVVNFSDSYFLNHILMAVKNTPENQKAFQTPEHANQSHIRIAIRTGSAPDLLLKSSHLLSKANILRFDTDADTVNAVLQDHADAFIYDAPYVFSAMKNNPGKLWRVPGEIETGSDAKDGREFGVAVRKKDSSLIESFNSFLKLWKKDGGYGRVYKLYFSDQDFQVQKTK